MQQNIQGNIAFQKGTDIAQVQGQFDYAASLVTQREGRVREDVSTDIYSLADQGNFDPKSMGDRVIKSKPKADLKKQEEKKKKKQEKKEKRGATNITDGKKQKKLKIRKGDNILNVEIDRNILYKPSTMGNKQIYQQIITQVAKQQDETSEVLKGLTDELLAILQIDNKSDKEKFLECQTLMPKLDQSQFDKLYSLSRQITDYGVDLDTKQNDDQGEMEMYGNLALSDNEEEEDDSMQSQMSEDSEEDESEEENLQAGVGARGIEIEEDEDEAVYHVDINDIDNFWIQTQLNQELDDAIEAANLEPKIMEILNAADDITCQSQLVNLLSYNLFPLIQKLTKNRYKIYYKTLLNQCGSEEEVFQLKSKMRSDPEGAKVLDQIEGNQGQQQNKTGNNQQKEREMKREVMGLKQQKQEEDQEKLNKLLMTQDVQDDEFNKLSKKYLELSDLQFHQGSHLMSNTKCVLPPETFKNSCKGYEEIYVPAVKQKPDQIEQVKISELPQWTHQAFGGVEKLNPIQSTVYKTALLSSENMLVCAPTGAGKTNVALMTMLHEIGKWRTDRGKIQLNKFKIVYISPMKALVAEQVGNFQKRLKSYGINVRELTGDMQLSKKQIEDTQVIISTPEKWDIVTRKAGDKTFTEFVKLIIIDEIHLLHDQRGPVLESLVARTIRQIESTQQQIRIVGLSATLPNYIDVASFIRVKKSGLFYFDSTYRPCPLEQQYIGVTEKKAVRRLILMNEILYNKVIERASKYQMIIFVHSRKDTVKTAKYLLETAYGKDELHKFVKEDSDKKKILTKVSEEIKNEDLKELLPNGFAIHHAGLERDDRQTVEDLFAGKTIQVLVSTATLAWGVNLPAHTIIIKGTQVYSPEEGKWTELSPQDVLQMMGRGGRPGYDTKGEGIILTAYNEMRFYLSLLNQQLPIESQFISNLPDQLNAEIVLGSVTNVKEAANWLGYTYLYIRMLRNPSIYGITEEEIQEDKLLVRRRMNLIHSAATLLDKNSLIKYDRQSGGFQVTPLGKIASHYYIKFNSIDTYNKNLKPNIGMIELFRIFSLSSEFKFIPIRDEEKGEILKLMETVPVPIKASSEDPTTKVNILLQAYIGQLSLDGFALNSDMIYITQSAGRIFRALFEICLSRGWAQAAESALGICKMIDKRMWPCMTVLRHFKSIPEELIKRIERKEQFTFEHFYNMSAQQIGELIKMPKLGKSLHRLIHQFPKLEVKPYLQPITRSCLKIDLTITPDFQWEHKVHGSSEPFWIFIEDCNGEEILHHEFFLLSDKMGVEQRDYTCSITVPLFENLHPLYYIKVISDRWLNSETIMPISFKNLILPERFSAPTELYDLQLLPLSNMKNDVQGQEVLQRIGVKQFNQIQTQVFQSFYQNTTQNVFLGAPTGSGKSICMYLSMITTMQEYPNKKIVYISPKEELCNIFYNEMSLLFSKQPFNKKIGILSGQLQSDQKIMDKHDIILATAENMDIFTRRWKQRKILKEIKLMIFDELHLLADNYSILDVLVSRMRIFQTQFQQQTKLQLIGLSTSVADYKEMSSWIGANKLNTYNFHPNVRPYPIEIIVYSMDHNDRKARILSMQKYMFQGIKRLAKERQSIVFVNDRKQAKLTGLELKTLCAADNDPEKFLRGKKSILKKMLEEVKIDDPVFLTILESGIGLLYEGQSPIEVDLVKLLYQQEIIQVLIVTYKLSWEITEHAYLTIVLDNQRYDGFERKYIDYTIPDMLQMISRSQNKESEGAAKSLVLCHTPKKDYYKRFLLDPYPVESHLNHYMNNHICGEIVAKNIKSKQDCLDFITWTFMYWRLSQNPNYYNLLEVSSSAINDYLSELIENTVEELEDMKCITVEEETELSPINLGIISSYYYIHTSSIEMFAENIRDDSKMNQLIQILANSTEFEEIALREGEEPIIRELSYDVNYKFDNPDFSDSAIKTNILIQSHFSRTNLTPDFRYDQKQVLDKAVRLVHAMVDVISSNCWLDQAIKAMQLNQMIVQALWANRSPLYQLPYITPDIVVSLGKKNVKDIEDFMNMEDEDREEILKHLSEEQVMEMAEAANRYPSISLSYEVADKDNLSAGDIVEVTVQVERDGYEDYTDYVIAPYYPKQKEEQWWIVIGEKSQNKIHGLKRINFKQNATNNIKFEISEAGEHDLTLYLVCDSYIGCDLAEQFTLNVAEGEEELEEEN